jgi:urease accessory protein UreF
LAQFLSTRKAVEQSTKKSLQEMTLQLTDAQSAQNKAEREANSFRDSLKSLREMWTREVKEVKDAMKQTEDKSKIDTAAAVSSRLARLTAERNPAPTHRAH